MSNYELLSSVRYQHEFYDISGSISINTHLLSATERELNNIDIIFKPSINGFKLYIDSERASDLIKSSDLCDDSILAFAVYPENNFLFTNITDRCIESEKNILIYSIDTKSYILKKETMFFDQSSYSSRNLVTEEMYKKIITCYQKNRPTCFITLPLKQIIKNIDKKTYTLTFKAKKSYYCYLINTEKIEASNLDLIDKINHTKFTGSKSAELKNYMAFISTTPLTTYYNDTKHYQLVSNNTDRKTILIDRLPLPKPGHFQKRMINRVESIISEVFIN